jgi:hypothetical protein
LSGVIDGLWRYKKEGEYMVEKFYCKYCGWKFSSRQSSTHNWCLKNSAGKTGQPHEAAL